MTTDHGPNIVLFLLDNIGFGDLGCYGGGVTRGAPTPVLDRLAAEGTRLTNFNVEAECTPSRAALLTGRLPVRTGCQRYLPPALPYGLSPWEYPLSTLLADSGYRTAIFGKWHLGNVQGRYPTDHGFDEWWGVRDSSDPSMFSSLLGFDSDSMEIPQLWEGRRGERCVPTEPYDLENRPLVDSRITERCVRYVEEHAGGDRPFFLYVPYSLVHHPSLPHPDFKSRTRAGDFADCMVEVDARTGEVLDALKRAGIEDDTIVIWASDNGPVLVPSLGPQGDSGPFRGYLGTALEGQLRTPCIVRWPGHVPAGRVSNEIFSIFDFYATLAAIVGVADRIPKDRAIDSIDQSAFLLGEQEHSNRESLLCFIGDELAAIKWRQFKIHFREFSTEPGRRTKVDLAVPQLYNVEQDPKEQWDIMEPNTWVAEPLLPITLDYLKSANQFPHIPTGGYAPVKGTGLDKPLMPRG
jgi:arylsulfatase